MDLTDPDYALKWPRDVFVAEATAMMQADTERQSFTADYGFLLEEVFAGPTPAVEYRAQRGYRDWVNEANDGDPVPVVSELVRRADELMTPATRRPYFSRRSSSEEPSDLTECEPDWESAKEKFTSLVSRWHASGYFGDEYPTGCVDEDERTITDLIERVADLYEQQPPPLAHTTGSEWSDDDFCDLIELLHDLAARPRSRRYHDYGNCGHHYYDHSLRTGQMLYRTRVNELLATNHLPFRLATDGEDKGRLVTVTDDARTELLHRAAEQPTGRLTTQVAHAIALYRSRQSTREDKISAIRELMAVLEPDRYSILKGTPAEKDNESLFQIANRYGIRHNKDNDLVEYSMAFLDWMFWAALAMVQLCKELKALDAPALQEQ